MAEIVNLFELDINVDSVITDITKSQKIIADLRQSINDLKKTEGDHSHEIALLTAQLKQESQELRINENLAKNLIKANKDNKDSVEVLRAKLQAVSIQWAKYTDEEHKNLAEGQKLEKQKLELTETVKKLEKATGDNRREVGNYALSVQGIRQELKELKAVMLSSAEGSEQYNTAMKRAAFLTDEMADMQEKIRGRAMDFGGVMGNVVKVTSGAASAFEAAQGAMALFGSESEDVQKAMLKIQAAIALANGLQGLEGFGKAFNNLLSQIKTFASGANKALLATGIGAFTVALGAILSNWDEISAAMSGVSESQKRLTANSEKHLSVEKAKLDMLLTQDNTLKLQGKSEKEILDLKIKQTDEVIAATTAQIGLAKVTQAHQIDAAKRNQELLAGVLSFTMIPLRVIDTMLTKIGKVFGKDWSTNLKQMDKYIASFVFDPKKVEEEGKATLAEMEKNLNDLVQARAGYMLEIQAIDKKAAEDSKKEVEKNNNEKLELQYKYLKEVADLRKQEAAMAIEVLDNELKAYQENEAAKVKTIQDSINLQSELEQAALKVKYDNQLITEQEYTDGIKAIRSKAFDELSILEAEKRQINYENELDVTKADYERQYQLQLENLNRQESEELKYAESIGANTELIKEKYNQYELELEQAKQEAKFAIASSFMNNLATIFGKQTAIGKAAAIASTTIETYAAAQKSYSALAGIPVVGPALGTAAAAAAIISGFENVKKILAVKTNLPGGSSVSANVSTNSTTAIAAQNAGVAPSVGSGIVSRNVIQNQTDKISVQPTLVIDDVTNKQLKNVQNNNTKLL